jgi:hypothetical protein
MVEETQRYTAELFPSDYESWRYCIEVKCGVGFTPEFLQERIAVLGDPRHEESQRFASLYGEAYLKQVLTWFERAAGEM